MQPCFVLGKDASQQGSLSAERAVSLSLKVNLDKCFLLTLRTALSLSLLRTLNQHNNCRDVSTDILPAHTASIIVRTSHLGSNARLTKKCIGWHIRSFLWLCWHVNKSWVYRERAPHPRVRRPREEKQLLPTLAWPTWDFTCSAMQAVWSKCLQ